MTEPRQVPVALAKRDFRRLLDAAERGERTIILRHGRPVASLGPVRPDRVELPVPRRPGGILSLLGGFDDWQSMDSDMAEVIGRRRQSADRPPPTLE